MRTPRVGKSSTHAQRTHTKSNLKLQGVAAWLLGPKRVVNDNQEPGIQPLGLAFSIPKAIQGKEKGTPSGRKTLLSAWNSNIQDNFYMIQMFMFFVSLQWNPGSIIQRFDPFQWNSLSSTVLVLGHSYGELWKVQSFDQSTCNSFLKITLARTSCFWNESEVQYKAYTRSIRGQPIWSILLQSSLWASGPCVPRLSRSLWAWVSRVPKTAVVLAIGFGSVCAQTVAELAVSFLERLLHLSWHLLWDPGPLLPAVTSRRKKEEARRTRMKKEDLNLSLNLETLTWQVGKNHLNLNRTKRS